MAVAMKYDQILEKASSEVQSLAQTRSEVEAKRQAASEEIAAIQAQATSRNAQLAALRQELKNLENTHDRVACELDLAQGSDLAAPLKRTLSQLVAELQAKRQAIAALEKNTEASAAKDAAQLQRLRDALAGYEKHLAEIDTKRAAVQAARDQFFASQGETEDLAIRARLAELHSLLEAAQEAEQSTRAALLRFSDEARERLAPWPELEKAIRSSLAYEDPTTRICKLAIELRDLLIEQGKSADIHPDIMRQAGMWGSSLAGEIALEPRQIWPAVNLNVSERPESLIESKRRLSKLLAMYIEVKR